MAQHEAPHGQHNHASTQPHRSTAHRTSRNNLKYGYLCIDLGTTASRLAYGSSELRGVFNEEPSVVKRDDASGERFESADWPSAMDCFSPGQRPEDCIGFSDDNPDSLPLKMFPYVLRVHKLHRRGLPGDSAAIRQIRKLIPQVHEFLIKFDPLKPPQQDRVIEHGLRIYITHLRQLKAESERQALAENIEIRELGATIPCNWDNWIQTLFVRILNIVWDSIDEDSIELIKEPHAAANWLMWLSPEMQQLRPKQVVLGDFGGHTWSYDAFHINYHSETSDRFSIAALWDTRCIHAGSELHAAHVRREVLEDIDRQAETEPLPLSKEKLYERLMSHYHFGKHKYFCTGEGFSLVYNPPQARNRRHKRAPFTVDFSKTKAQKLYDKCFGTALKSLQKLVDSPRIKRGSIVVLTGGSFRNDHVRAIAEEMIKAGGLVCPEWPKSRTVGNSRSARIVSGAVMCLINAGTVADFMARAAFAVRFSIRDVVTAHAIWNRGKSQSVTKSLTSPQGGDTLLICSPRGLDGDIPMQPLGLEFFENAYDFHIVEKYKKDLLRMSMEHLPAGKSISCQDEIVLTIEHLRTGAPKSVLRWPIFFDKSHGLCLVDNISLLSTSAQKQSGGGRDRRSSAQRRINIKGERARRQWEQDCNDSGSFYWGRTGNTVPLKDLNPTEILQQGASAQRILNQNSTSDNTNLPAPPSSPSPAVTLRTQPQVKSRPQNERPSDIASSSSESREQTRKRRGTSSANKPVPTKRKPEQLKGTTATTSCSFTTSRFALAPHSNSGETGRCPYAVMSEEQQAPLAEENPRQHATYNTTLSHTEVPPSRQGNTLTISTANTSSEAYRAVEGVNGSQRPSEAQRTSLTGPQSTATFQEMPAIPLAPRLSPGLSIVSNGLEPDFDYYLHTWDTTNSGHHSAS